LPASEKDEEEGEAEGAFATARDDWLAQAAALGRHSATRGLLLLAQAVANRRRAVLECVGGGERAVGSVAVCPLWCIWECGR
jgi:hypothetical protein